MISKEYKEDMIQGYDVMKSKMVHSNSVDGKLHHLHSLQESSRDRNSLVNLKSQRAFSGQSKGSKNEADRVDSIGSTLDQKANMLIQGQDTGVRNMQVMANQQLREEGLDNRVLSKKQPKYFKNMDMPASVPSHQNGIQQW